LVKRYILGFGVGLLLICAVYTAIVFTVPNPEVGNLPYYTFRTLLRIVVTYLIALVFGLFFGILAACNKTASTILVPLFDVLQSIPILGYFPAAVIFFVSGFPGGEMGKEVAAMLLLFTSMEWAIFFGIIGAVKNIPSNIVEVAEVFGLKGLRYIRHVVLPAIVPALVSASTLAWGDGWFFIIAAEYITYGGQPYALPGIGAFLAKAAYEYGDLRLSIAILILMTSIVFYINFLTWHRLTERAGAGTYKPVLKLDLISLQRSLHLSKIRVRWLHVPRLHLAFRFRHVILPASKLKRYTHKERVIAVIFGLFIIFFVILALTGTIPSLEYVVESLNVPEMSFLPLYTASTLGRMIVAYFISLAIAIVMGVLAAENKKFAAIFYPMYDIGQSVPILALFPILFLSLSAVFGGRAGLEITSITMLVADMIWYLFLNVVGAVKTIPEEIREVGRIFGFKGLKRIRHVVLPAITPAIVTGSMLSWATGWNTIIFSEYMPYGKEVFWLPGLGYFLDKAAYVWGNTILLVFLLTIVSALVILVDRFIWRRLLLKFEKYKIEVF